MKPIGTKEAAEMLGIAAKTLANWCSAGKITFYKVGGLRKFKIRDIERFIEAGRVRAIR